MEWIKNKKIIWTIIIELIAILEIWLFCYIGYELLKKEWIITSFGGTAIIIFCFTIILPIILFYQEPPKDNGD